MSERGVVMAVCISSRKGTAKRDVGEARVVAGSGLEGDAHAGPWHRQVSLLAWESIARVRARGLEVGPGDFAENITIKGLALRSLPVGSKLQIGLEVLLEVTQIGKECHERCAVYRRIGDCIMPREGVFCRVLRGGTVKRGDQVVVLPATAGSTVGLV